MAPGTWDGFKDGVRAEVPFPWLGTPRFGMKLADRLAAPFLGGGRPWRGRQYAAAADALGRSFAGVIFIHNEPAGVEVFARRCPAARVCLWVHNDPLRSYTRRQVRRVIAHWNRVICVSDFVRRRIDEKVGGDAHTVTVLNGVDTATFCPPPLILFVGGMVAERGPHLLV